MDFNKWMNENALGVNKEYMLAKIQKRYGVSHAKALEAYNSWRKRYINSLVIQEEEETIEQVITSYLKKNRAGIKLEQIIKYIELKQKSIRSNAEISRVTGLTLQKINNLQSFLVQSGYRLQQIQELDIERIKKLKK